MNKSPFRSSSTGSLLGSARTSQVARMLETANASQSHAEPAPISLAHPPYRIDADGQKIVPPSRTVRYTPF